MTELISQAIEMHPTPTLLKQGAEAKIYVCTFLGKPTIIKERFKKSYRHPSLDSSLTVQRSKAEVRCMARCRANGIRTPVIYFVDMEDHKIYMEYLQDSVTVKDHIIQFQAASSDLASLRPLAEKIGDAIGLMHSKGIIHGDLTTSNMLLVGQPENLEVVFIDFGLGSIEGSAEDKAVDLYVLEKAMLSTHPSTEPVLEAILNSYITVKAKDSQEVIRKLNEVRLRGRKRTMVG